MKRICYKNDFDLKLRRRKPKDKSADEWEYVPMPGHDWMVRLFTAESAGAVTAAYRNGCYRNCFNDGGVIHVVMNNHHLMPGRLMMEMYEDIPDPMYPDGMRRVVTMEELDVVLTRDSGDCPTEMEVEVMLPYVKGKDAYEYAVEQGYAGSAEEFARQLAGVGGKQTRLSVSDDMELTADGALSITERAKRSVFIDMWNRECAFKGVAGYFGGYNGRTGYFELNGITDITYEEALRIWARSGHGMVASGVGAVHKYRYGGGCYRETVEYARCRTYFPVICSGGYTAPDLTEMFRGNATVETLTFVGGYGNSLGNFPRLGGAFNGCVRLRGILCNIGLPFVDGSTFGDCESLEELDVTMYVDGGTYGNLNLQWSPNLSDESMARIINQARLQKPGNSMSLVLHPAAYARVTDGLFAVALEKNINISTTA